MKCKFRNEIRSHRTKFSQAINSRSLKLPDVYVYGVISFAMRNLLENSFSRRIFNTSSAKYHQERYLQLNDHVSVN